MARLPLWSLVALLGACGPSPTEPQVAPVAVVPTTSAPASAPAASASAPPLRPSEARVPVRDTDARWGSDQAPVTAVVFGRVGLDSDERLLAQLDEVQRRQGEGKLRVVWKALSVEDQSPAFKQAQIVAGVAHVSNGATIRKFLALARQRPADTFRIQGLMAMVGEAGVSDVPALEKRIVADEFAPVAHADSLLAERLRVTFPGVVFVNGFRLSGRIKKDALAAIVADELRLTEALLAKGTPLAEAYALRTQDNASKAQDFPERRPDLKLDQRYRIALGASPSLGDRKALVTLVIFGGYQEPFMRRAQATIKLLQAHYKSDLRVVWKHSPLSEMQPLSEPLSLATLQLRIDGGDAAFWRAHGTLLDDKTWTPFAPQLGQRDPASGMLEKLRTAIGVKKGKEPSEAARQSLAADKSQAQALNLIGRPVFFINGRPLTGSQPEASFRTLIDAELAAAREQVKAGVKPEQVYDALMTPLPESSDE